VNRRALLASAAVTGVALLAGCSDGGTDYAHFVTVYNYVDASHTVSITAEDDDGETVFDESYDMDGRSAREHVTFDADPATATVVVDDGEPKSLDWPSAEHCDEQGTAGKPGLEVSVGPERTDEEPTVRTEWSCQSVEP